VLVLGHSGKYTIVARHWVDALAIGVMIWTATRFPATSFGRVLNWGPLVWLGRLSYSLYLWQQVFLDDTSAAWICRFPQNFMLCLPAAMVSYYLIERPCLALKPRYVDRERSSAASPTPQSLENDTPALRPVLPVVVIVQAAGRLERAQEAGR
jgi:peptidoglycan/LPS O-acetylase OafA/YrhL